MEVGRDTSEDAWIAARKCLQAMAGQDEATRRSLLRAACKYMSKYRRERCGERIAALRTGHGLTRGDVSAREG